MFTQKQLFSKKINKVNGIFLNIHILSLEIDLNLYIFQSYSKFLEFQNLFRKFHNFFFSIIGDSNCQLNSYMQQKCVNSCCSFIALEVMVKYSLYFLINAYVSNN